jgi:hypothetical protein
MASTIILLATTICRVLRTLTSAHYNELNAALSNEWDIFSCHDRNGFATPEGVGAKGLAVPAGVLRGTKKKEPQSQYIIRGR